MSAVRRRCRSELGKSSSGEAWRGARAGRSKEVCGQVVKRVGGVERSGCVGRVVGKQAVGGRVVVYKQAGDRQAVLRKAKARDRQTGREWASGDGREGQSRAAAVQRKTGNTPARTPAARTHTHAHALLLMAQGRVEDWAGPPYYSN